MEKFIDFELSDGSKCTVLKIRPWDFWKAQRNCSLQNEVDVVAFVMQEVVLINDKKQSIHELGLLEIKDYIKICESLEVQTKEFNF